MSLLFTKRLRPSKCLYKGDTVIPVSLSFAEAGGLFVQTTNTNWPNAGVHIPISLPNVKTGNVIVLSVSASVFIPPFTSNFFTITDNQGNFWGAVDGHGNTTPIVANYSNYPQVIFAAVATADGTLNIDAANFLGGNSIVTATEYRGLAVAGATGALQPIIDDKAMASNYSFLPNPMSLTFNSPYRDLLVGFYSTNGSFGICGSSNNLPLYGLETPGFVQRLDDRFSSGGSGITVSQVEAIGTGPINMTWGFGNQIANVAMASGIALRVATGILGPNYGGRPYFDINLAAVNDGALTPPEISGAFVTWRVNGNNTPSPGGDGGISDRPLQIDVLDTGFSTSVGAGPGNGYLCTGNGFTFRASVSAQAVCAFIPLETTGNSVIRVSAPPFTTMGVANIVFTNRKTTPYQWSMMGSVFPPFEKYTVPDIYVNGVRIGPGVAVNGVFDSNSVAVNGTQIGIW